MRHLRESVADEQGEDRVDIWETNAGSISVLRRRGSKQIFPTATQRLSWLSTNAPHQDFELILQPRWVHVSGKGKNKRIGFQISDPPAEWLDFVEGVKGEDVDRGKRTDQRFSTLGLMAIISDGKARYFGVVESISENGLRLKQIPPEFNDAAENCTAVVNSPTGDVNISLRPCWIQSTNRGMYKTVGFQIHNPPKGWQGLLDELKSENGHPNFLILGDDDDQDE